VVRLAFSPEQRQKMRNVLITCWAGRGVRSTPSGPMELTPDACFWSRPGGEYHVEQEPATPLGLTAIHFDLLEPGGQILDPAELTLPPERLIARHPGLVRSCTNWIADLAMDSRSGIGPDAAIEQAATLVFRGLLIMLDHDTPRRIGGVGPQPVWTEVTSYIQQHLHEAPTVGQLARQFAYTRSHFSRLFKARVGLSPQQYLINARLALAKELLRTTQLPIGQVALQAGYNDPYAFSKQFRQLAGVSPTRYRARF
jgi:AraC-like DNA-binding protein